MIKLNKEVFIKDKDFYIRSGPSTDKLEGKELLNYTKSRFFQIYFYKKETIINRFLKLVDKIIKIYNQKLG